MRRVAIRRQCTVSCIVMGEPFKYGAYQKKTRTYGSAYAPVFFIQFCPYSHSIVEGGFEEMS